MKKKNFWNICIGLNYNLQQHAYRLSYLVIRDVSNDQEQDSK